MIEKIRIWIINKLGGYVSQNGGSIVGQKDGSILIKIEKIDDLDVESHGFGVFTVRSIHNNGYPKVQAKHFDKDCFPDLYVLDKKDLD